MFIGTDINTHLLRFPVMIMLEETCDNPPMVMVVSESRLLSVIPPCTTISPSVSGTITINNVEEIQGALIAEGASGLTGLFLPETVSQLLSWFASFWLEMVTLLEPIGNELQSWQDIIQGLSRRISNWISANLTRRDDSNLPSGDCQRMALLEPIGNELQSWQDKQAVYYLQAVESATALCHASSVAHSL
jgi:hypothetical protein